jgi:hypothetical protein
MTNNLVVIHGLEQLVDNVAANVAIAAGYSNCLSCHGGYFSIALTG